MPLFKKKPPPVWYVLRPAKSSSSNSDRKREGPYTRATISQMYGEGMLGDGALIWTNEKIFPNAQRPNSFRPVRIMEWRRLDELPDPVVRQLGAEWQEMMKQQSYQSQEHPQNAKIAPSTNYAQVHPHDPPPSSGVPPPPTGGIPTVVVQPQNYHSAPSSVYPAGVAVHQNPGTGDSSGQSPSHPNSFPTPAPPPPQPDSGYSDTVQISAHQHQHGAYHHPSAYPAPAVHPPPALAVHPPPAPGAA